MSWFIEYFLVGFKIVYVLFFIFGLLVWGVGVCGFRDRFVILVLGIS